MQDIIKKEKNQNDFILSETILFSWQASEYEFVPKSNRWFWMVGIITFGIIMAAITLKNWTFAMFVFLAGFTLAMLNAQKPKIITFSITKEGIKIQNQLYPYNMLKSFWIQQNINFQNELSLESKKTMMPYLTLPLTREISSDKIRSLIVQFLPEKEHHPSIIDFIARQLGT